MANTSLYVTVRPQEHAYSPSSSKPIPNPPIDILHQKVLIYIYMIPSPAGTTQEPYKPKANHPWRNYRVKFNEKNKPIEEDKPQFPAVSIKNFLKELVDNYDDYQVPSPNELNGLVKLSRMREDKVAEWLIDFLKRNWLIQTKGLVGYIE